MAAAAPSQVEITIARHHRLPPKILNTKRLELGWKHVASIRGASKPKPKPGSSLPMTPKQKKRAANNGSNNGFLPSICSVVEITETSYRNLKTEGKKLPREG